MHIAPHTPLVTLKRALFAFAFLIVGLVTASAQAAPQLSVAWDDNSTDETGFEVWRSQGAGNTTFAVVGTVAANIKTYVDTNLPYGTVFNYKVRAVNASVTPPLTSTFSNTATATTTADTTAPTAPTGFAASAVTQTSLTLAWSASTDNAAVTGYRITRNGTILKTVTTLTTTDTGLTAFTSYTYTVVALDAAGNVSPAASLTVTTLQIPAPAAPSNVTATVLP